MSTVVNLAAAYHFAAVQHVEEEFAWLKRREVGASAGLPEIHLWRGRSRKTGRTSRGR